MRVTSQLCVWEQLRIPSIDKTSAWRSCWSQMLTQTPRLHPILWFHCTVELLLTFCLWYFLTSRRKWQVLYTTDRHKLLDTPSVDKQWKISWSTTAQSVFSAKTLCLNQPFLHYCCKSFERIRWLQRDSMTEVSITWWPLTLMSCHIYFTMMAQIRMWYRSKGVPPLYTWWVLWGRRPQTCPGSAALGGILSWRSQGTCPPQLSPNSPHTQTVEEEATW